MRRRAGPVTEISVTGLEIFPQEQASPVTGMKIFQVRKLLSKEDEISIILTYLLDFLIKNDFWNLNESRNNNFHNCRKENPELIFLCLLSRKQFHLGDKIHPANQASPGTGLI